MTAIDLYELLRQAIWDGRWFALVSVWNAALAHPWILILMVGAIMLKGRRTMMRAARWIAATWWHHSQH